jgi:hypothetical protein
VVTSAPSSTIFQLPSPLLRCLLAVSAPPLSFLLDAKTSDFSRKLSFDSSFL